MIALLNIGDGHTNKFEEIYRTYSRHLYAIGLKTLKDADSASDALQLCYFKIYQNIDRIKDIESKQTRSFLGDIMRSQSLTIYNKYSMSCNEEDFAKAAGGDMPDAFDRWEKEAVDVKIPANTEFIILSMADEFHKIQVREERKKFFKRFLRIAAVIILAAAAALTVLAVSVIGPR
jgi:DNA-directed RNA polymerase specialized sigma24 family protein